MSIEKQIRTTLDNNPNMTLGQVLYVRYFTAILVDLVVLGLLDEYWSKVEITSFAVALMAAVLLQVLLQLSMLVEERSAQYFKKKGGTRAKVMRILSAWAILFVSKLIILWAIDVFFGNSFFFHGWFHGIVPFLVMVFAMIFAEMLVRNIFISLGHPQETEEE